MFDQATPADSSLSPATTPCIGVVADLVALGIEVGGVVGCGIASGVTGPGRRPADDADSGRPRTLAALGAEVEYRLGGFDAARCTGAQAVEVVEGTERMIRILQAAQLAAIGRAEETGAWRDTDVRGCTEWVRRTLDRPWSQAHRLVAAAGHLREQPHLARLAATGEVTVDRIVTAAETVAERPDAAVAVCTAATRGERSDFNALCRRYRQAGETDEARAARQRRNRRAGASTDADGMFDFRALGPADEGAELQSLYQPWVDQALRESWALGTPVTAAQARWDALLAMARAAAEPPTAAAPASASASASASSTGSTSSRRRRPAGLARGRGSRVKVIVRVDLAALLRGWVAAGELCDLSGTGEIDVAAVRRLIADGAFLTAVLTGSTAPPGSAAATVLASELSAADATDVAHLGRVAPDHPLVPPIAPGASPGHGSTDPSTDPPPDRWHRFLEAFLGGLAGHLQPVEQCVHAGRHPDAVQRTVLELCHPVCSVPGCTMAWGLEADHVHPFIDTRETRLTDLDRKCGPHHRQKSERENRERRQRTLQERTGQERNEQERRERPVPTGERSAVEACA